MKANISEDFYHAIFILSVTSSDHERNKQSSNVTSEVIPNFIDQYVISERPSVISELVTVVIKLRIDIRGSEMTCHLQKYGSLYEYTTSVALLIYLLLT